MKDLLLTMVVGLGVLAIPAGAIGGLLWGFPQYKVYSYEMSGKAILARSENERQVLVQKAQAELDAASKQAEAISIVGAAYAEFPEYREAMYYEAMGEAVQNGAVKLIYVPISDSGLPITEAGRLK
ncbi:putative membrane protease subunit [Vibrio phage 177E37-1]|nr:putative membrane protease subunit [Vibrio phage 177E37-1]